MANRIWSNFLKRDCLPAVLHCPYKSLAILLLLTGAPSIPLSTSSWSWKFSVDCNCIGYAAVVTSSVCGREFVGGGICVVFPPLEYWRLHILIHIWVAYEVVRSDFDEFCWRGFRRSTVWWMESIIIVITVGTIECSVECLFSHVCRICSWKYSYR